MSKLTNKEKRKLYLIGYKSVRKNRPTQDEHDLKMVKKIKECSRGGKIAVGVTSQYFYDSYDYNVETYMMKEFIIFHLIILLTDIYTKKLWMVLIVQLV